MFCFFTQCVCFCQCVDWEFFSTMYTSVVFAHKPSQKLNSRLLMSLRGCVWQKLTNSVYPQTCPSCTVSKDESLIPPFLSPLLPLSLTLPPFPFPVSITQAPPPSVSLLPLLTAADQSGNADAGLWLKIYQTLKWWLFSRYITYQTPLNETLCTTFLQDCILIQYVVNNFVLSPFFSV